MPSELSRVEFTLEDTIDGQELTPENVDLPTLRGFLTEVEKLIKGNVPGASLSDSRVRIEEGSVRIAILAAHLLAQDVRTDISRLEATGDLDQLQPRRAEVLEAWQARVRSMPTRRYSIVREPGAPPLRVTRETHLQHGSENRWVSVEKYLTGKVVDAGGKHEPNIHLVLSETGESLRVSATEQQLRGEKENQLYKVVTLHVQAEQHLDRRELRNVRLLHFLPHAEEADERALATLWQKGREAWRDVRSGAEWVEELRGNR